VVGRRIQRRLDLSFAVYNFQSMYNRKMLNITKRQAEKTTILDLEGNVILGGGSRRLGEEVRQLAQAGISNVLLNFTNVKYIDSSGVGELFSSLELIKHGNGSLKLSNLPTKVREVLALSGFLPMFDIYDDENAAIQSNSLSDKTEIL
jgi:anti-anti-sigma factor